MDRTTLLYIASKISIYCACITMGISSIVAPGTMCGARSSTVLESGNVRSLHIHHLYSSTHMSDLCLLDDYRALLHNHRVVLDGGRGGGLHIAGWWLS